MRLGSRWIRYWFGYITINWYYNSSITLFILFYSLEEGIFYFDLMRYLLQPLLLFILLTLVNSQCDQESSIISFGEGIATGIPDIATLYVLITNTSPTATTATRNIRETLNQILRITDWYGVPISNIEIVDINLAPIMDQSNVVGFQANQTLGIKGISIISPVASLIGTLYEQLTKLSGLVLSGLTF